MNQQVLHLGDDGKFPVVQHLGQIGTGPAAGKFHWRQRWVAGIRPISNSGIFIVANVNRLQQKQTRFLTFSVPAGRFQGSTRCDETEQELKALHPQTANEGIHPKRKQSGKKLQPPGQVRQVPSVWLQLSFTQGSFQLCLLCWWVCQQWKQQPGGVLL